MAKTRRAVTSRSHTSNRCAGIRSDGKPCRAFRLEDREHCYFHCDEIEAKRRSAQKRGAAVTNAIRWGGLQEEMPENLRSVEDLMRLVEVVLRSCIKSDLDAKTANALGGLVRVQAALLVDLQFEKRLKALEEAAKEKPHGSHDA